MNDSLNLSELDKLYFANIDTKNTGYNRIVLIDINDYNKFKYTITKGATVTEAISIAKKNNWAFSGGESGIKNLTCDRLNNMLGIPTDDLNTCIVVSHEYNKPFIILDTMSEHKKYIREQANSGNVKVCVLLESSANIKADTEFYSSLI